MHYLLSTQGEIVTIKQEPSQQQALLHLQPSNNSTHDETFHPQAFKPPTKLEYAILALLQDMNYR